MDPINVDVTMAELMGLGGVPALRSLFEEMLSEWVGDLPGRLTDVRAGTLIAYTDGSDHLRIEFVARFTLP